MKPWVRVNRPSNNVQMYSLVSHRITACLLFDVYALFTKQERYHCVANIFVRDKRDSNKVVIASRPSVRFESYDKSFPSDLFF